jgi:hypothetical protein
VGGTRRARDRVVIDPQALLARALNFCATWCAKTHALNRLKKYLTMRAVRLTWAAEPHRGAPPCPADDPVSTKTTRSSRTRRELGATGLRQDGSGERRQRQQDEAPKPGRKGGDACLPGTFPPHRPAMGSDRRGPRALTAKRSHDSRLTCRRTNSPKWRAWQRAPASSASSPSPIGDFPGRGSLGLAHVVVLRPQSLKSWWVKTQDPHFGAWLFPPPR